MICPYCGQEMEKRAPLLAKDLPGCAFIERCCGICEDPHELIEYCHLDNSYQVQDKLLAGWFEGQGYNVRKVNTDTYEIRP